MDYHGQKLCKGNLSAPQHGIHDMKETERPGDDDDDYEVSR